MKTPPPNPMRGTAARPRNPGTISSGLLGWWRADSGVFSDTDGTTPAVNGGPVARWNDLSGAGRNATQATALNQPTYTANAIAGYPGIKVIPSSWLATAAVAAAANTDLTLMGVFDAPVDTANNHCVSTITSGDLPAPPTILLCYWFTGTPATAGGTGRDNTGAGVRATPTAGSGGNVAVARLTTGGALSTQLGATRSATNTGANHANTSNVNICPAGRIDMPMAANGINCLETAVWSRSLTNAEVASLIAYAKARYGL